MDKNIVTSKYIFFYPVYTFYFTTFNVKDATSKTDL